MITDVNTFFRQATLYICGDLELKSALRELVVYLKPHMPADSIELNIYDRGLTALKTIVVGTSTDAREVNTILPIDETGRAFLEDPDLPPARIINDPLKDPVTRKFIKKMESTNRSSIVMYLSIKGVKIGNVVLFAEGLNRYREEHMRLFLTLNEPFAIALSNALRYNELNQLKELLADDIQDLHRSMQRFPGDEVIGGDFGLKGVMEMVRKVAPLNSPVLLLGESGVGKEIIANAIHTSSKRRAGPFVRINCGAIPETLIDSELFGYEKGAFTGALSQKRGYFERAEGGTILLDEVAELPPHAQISMLRTLQSKDIIRVGGTDQIKVDIRVIAATHRNLREMVKEGLFREDLWFRLHVFPITIPPLRNRTEDIPSLVNYFIEEKAKELQLKSFPEISRGAMELLMAYSWPGNVRELENVVERELILSKGQPLTFNNIVWVDNNDRAEKLKRNQDETLNLDLVISQHIRKVMKMTEGKINGPSGAAKLMGINPGTLRSKMRKLGIPFGRNTIHTG